MVIFSVFSGGRGGLGISGAQATEIFSWVCELVNCAAMLASLSVNDGSKVKLTLQSLRLKVGSWTLVEAGELPRGVNDCWV